MDRKMAKSVYFREPGGVLPEVVTDQPGFVFEPPDHLGESLVLIGDLEYRRAELERRFPLLPNPRAAKHTAERTRA
jgi:glyoxalase family protein